MKATGVIVTLLYADSARECGLLSTAGEDGADAGGSCASLFKIAPDIHPILASGGFVDRAAMRVNLLQVFPNSGQLLNQLRQCRLSGFPDSIQIDFKIAVGDTVAHAFHAAQR